MSSEPLKIDLQGNVTTFAGSGTAGSDNGQGTSAKFNKPYGIAIDSVDNIFVVDNKNNKIRKITPGGLVSTFAGDGVERKLDGQGTAASLDCPTNIVIDSSDNIYVAEYCSSSIRKITPSGAVSTFAGTGSRGQTDKVNGTSASFDRPYGMVFDADSNMYVAEYGNDVIRKITPGREVSLYAGAFDDDRLVDGSRLDARFDGPVGITIDSAGNLYVSEYGNKTVRKIDANGNVTTVADGFSYPYGMTTDHGDNIFVSDYTNNTIKKIHLVGDTVRFNIQVADIAGNSNYVTSTTDGSVVAMNIDGDGFTDAVEIAAGSSVTDANSMPVPDFTETVGEYINDE